MNEVTYKGILKEKYGADDPAQLTESQRWQAYETLKKHIRRSYQKENWPAREYKRRIIEVVEFLGL